ncbi:MAG: PD-(D/E)XK nuclease family protein, partial [Candidatus Binatia bacterium]
VAGDQVLQDRLDVVRHTFQQSLHVATQPIATPTSATLEAAGPSADDELSAEAERARKAEAGRFGAAFGVVVHRALALLLSDSAEAVPQAVSLAAEEVGLTGHRAEAEADVQRALDTLRRFGILGNPSVTLAPEYPLAVRWKHGKLLSGFADLLILGTGTATVIDFKTDVPAPGPLTTAHPRYAAQLRLYGDLLQAANLVGSRQLRLGLLFTASGTLRWL